MEAADPGQVSGSGFALPESELAFYRPAVGIMLLNAQGRVFVGRRLDMPAGLAAWQMPQGGIDPGETAAQAALRELHEEVGTDKAVILAETQGWLYYDLPADIAGRMWGGKYRGQRQKWFAMRFTGTDRDIDPGNTHHPEFDAWEWVAPSRLPELIVPFKRPLYMAVLAEFQSLPPIACSRYGSRRFQHRSVHFGFRRYPAGFGKRLCGGCHRYRYGDRRCPADARL